MSGPSAGGGGSGASTSAGSATGPGGSTGGSAGGAHSGSGLGSAAASVGAGVAMGIAGDLVAPIISEAVIDAEQTLHESGRTTSAVANLATALMGVVVGGFGLATLLSTRETDAGIYGLIFMAVGIVILLVAVGHERGRRGA